MAKQIKLIKCPVCGSTQKTQTSEDHYKCNNCGSEYYLDDDDININVTYRNAPTPPPYRGKKSNNPLKYIIPLVLVIAIILGINMCSSLLSGSKGGGRSKTYSGFSQTIEADYPVTTNGQDTYILTLANRYYRNMSSGDDSRNGGYYAFIDIKSGEIKESGKIDNCDKMKNADIRKFSEGKLYAIINKKYIYEVDAKNLTIVDVTTNMLSSDPLYSAGIASVEFIYKRYGPGFKIMTNAGKELNYYPLINRSYTEKQLNKADNGFNTLLPTAKDSIYYAFTNRGTGMSDMEQADAVQLQKITYKYNGGGPEWVEFSPTWNRHYGYGNTIALFNKDRSRIVSHINVTPDRLYFDPYIVYYDNTHLLIKYKVTAADDAPINLQSIDVKTGDIKWTTVINPKYDYRYYLEQTVLINGRYYIKSSSRNYVIIDEDGNNLEYFELR